MELNNLTEFKSSPEIREKLSSYGTAKTFAEGDVILNENAYINAIPIVTKGSIRVLRTDEDGREILLYYIRAGESCIMSFLGGMHPVWRDNAATSLRCASGNRSNQANRFLAQHSIESHDGGSWHNVNYFHSQTVL